MKKNLLFLLAFMLFGFCASAQNTSLLNESFEGDVFPPDGWVTLMPYGSSSNAIKQYSDYSNSGSYSAAFAYTNSGEASRYLVTPKLVPQEGDSIVFYLRIAYPTYFQNFDVLLSTTSADSSAFTTVLHSFSSSEMNTSSFTRFAFSLEDYVDEEIYIAFHDVNDDGSSIYLDDVSGVHYIPPTCSAPAGIATTNVTTTSATITWNSLAELFNVYYREYGAAEWQVEENVPMSDEGYTLEGLTPSTTYQYKVEAVCEEGNMTSDINVFTTECGGAISVAATPYEQNFDAVPAQGIPSCWTRVSEFNYSGNSGIETYPSVNNTYGGSDPNMLMAAYNGPVIVLALPEFTEDINTLRLYFEAKVAKTDAAPLEIGYLPSAESTAADFQALTSLSAADYTPSNWNNAVYLPYVVNFDTLETVPAGVIALRVNSANSTVFCQWHLDNFMVSLIPSCEAPAPLSLSSSNITKNSADLTWEEVADTYSVFYKAEGDNEFTEVPGVSLENGIYTLSGLTPETNYTWYVVSHCEGNNSSMPSQQRTFSTLCDVQTEFPYQESFENGLGCWTTSIVSGDYAWRVLNVSTGVSASDGEQFAFFPYYEDGVAYLVSPQFDLSEMNEPVLSYDLYIRAFLGYYDSVAVHYRASAEDDWAFLAGHGDNGGNTAYWTYKMALPNPTSTYQIMFEGVGRDANSLMLDNITIKNIECAAPKSNSVAFSDVTAHTATVSWTDNNENHDAWVVYYKASADEEWETMPADETTLEITGLAPETTYQVYVITNCGSEEEDPDATDIKTFTTTIACPAPTNITFSNVGATSATVSWTGVAESFIVQWGESEEETATVSDNSFEITGLTASTNYAVKVKADCGEEDGLSTEATASFMTSACEVENQCEYIFDLGDLYGDGWNGARISVRQDSVEVASLTMPSSTSTFSTTINLCHGSEISLVWVAGIYDGECSFTVTGPARDVLYASTTLSAGTLTTFDAVCFGICKVPVNLTVSNVGTSSATVSWSDEADTYVVVWGEGEEETATVEGDTTYTITGLEPATSYTVKVKAVCGEDSESAFATVVFKTLCTAIPASALPYSIDFEGGTTYTMPDCWTKVQGDGDSYSAYPGYYNTTAHSGTMVFDLDADAGTNTAALPLIDEDLSLLRVNFWVKPYLSTAYGMLEIGVISDVNDTTSFQTVATITPSDLTNTSTYTNVKVPFNNITLEEDVNYLIAFRVKKTTSADWLIDDLIVEYIPECPEPMNVSVSGITAKTAVLTWTPGDATQTSFVVKYKAASDTEWQQEDVTISDGEEASYTIEGLTPETAYSAFVETTCGEGYPSNTVNFTTLVACPAPTALQVSDITTNSATITWTGDAESYIVTYGEETATAYDNSIELTGLSTATYYTVSVKADCGEEDGLSSAATISFMTNCDVVSEFPFTESFENGLGCWTATRTTGYSNWTSSTSYQYTTIPDGSKYMKLSNTSWTEERAELTSPIMDLTSLENPYLSYYHIQEAWGSDQGKLYVYYRTSPSAEKVLLASFTNNIDSWQKDSIALPSPSAEYQIIFEGAVNYDRGVGVDMVEVYSFDGETPEECMAPTGLAVSGQTQTSANVTWTAGGNETSWKLQYKLASANGWTNPEVTVNTTPSYTITGLTAGTDYEVRVKAVCGSGNESVWTSSASFTTLNEDQEPCNAPTNVTVTDFGKNSITITWDANGAEKWAAQYRKQGSTAWTMGSNNITSPTYTFSGLEEATVYEYQVQAVCDGTTSAWSQTGSHSTGIDSRLMNSLSLYPNPATNHVDVLVSDNDVTVSRLEVYDVYGKLLNEVEVVDNPTRIDVSSLASGVYFVKVITGEGVATKTFVKK